MKQTPTTALLSATLVLALGCTLVLAVAAPLRAQEQVITPPPHVLLRTSQGDIVLELNREKAPVTVENFLGYVRSGFYDGTLFHRVIKDFMIQGGGYTDGYERKPTRPPIRNEADNGLQNLRGTIAMARTADPHSATAQFFINTADNAFLDYRAPTARDWGYAVFGKVIDGMDTIDRIQNLPTGSGGPFASDVPATPVIIEKATVMAESGDVAHNAR